MAFLHGLGFGLAMMVFIGPVFFYLLKTSLQHGSRSGMAAAIGIFVSDVTAVVLCYFFARRLFEGGQNEFWLSIIGGTILIVFGLGYIFKPKLPSTKAIKINKSDYATFFTKAFLVNFVNPFVFLIWISIIGVGQNKYDTEHEVVVFLAAALIGVITTDTLKVLGCRYLRKVIEPAFLIKVYRVIGLFIVGFSLRLYWHAATL